MRMREAYKDQSDSLRMKFSLAWAVFEKGEPVSSVSSRGPDAVIDQMIQDEINRKTTRGYTYLGKIGAAAYYLPPEAYQGKDL